LAKKDFLQVLHRAHIPEERIKAADEQLHDPSTRKETGYSRLRTAWIAIGSSVMWEEPVSRSTNVHATGERHPRRRL
jgi:hypothetical protein